MSAWIKENPIFFYFVIIIGVWEVAPLFKGNSYDLEIKKLEVEKAKIELEKEKIKSIIYKKYLYLESLPETKKGNF